MALPEPSPGLVVRYAYLWSHEAAAGAEEGAKDRPCAVLLATTTRSGRQVVTVLPVTHSPPADPDLAVAIPPATKRRLGLDDDQSWVILNESNRFYWPGPDLRPVPGDETGTIAYGHLPSRLYDHIRDKWLAAYDRGRASAIARSD